VADVITCLTAALEGRYRIESEPGSRKNRTGFLAGGGGVLNDGADMKFRMIERSAQENLTLLNRIMAHHAE